MSILFFTNIYLFFSVYSSILVGLGKFYYVFIPIILVLTYSQRKIIGKHNYLISLVVFLGLISFQSLFILLGNINSNNFYEAINNSKFLLIFLLLPTFIYLYKVQKIELLFNYLSVFVLSKFLVIFLVILGLYFFNLDRIFVFDTLHIKVNIFGNLGYQVFDKILIFFPIALLITEKLNLLMKTIIHLLVLFVLLNSFTLGIISLYFIIIIFIWKEFAIIIYTFALFYFLFLLDFTVVMDSIDTIIKVKSYSGDVKMEQWVWVFNKLQDMLVIGHGLGYKFDIVSNPQGYLIENLYIYFIAIYGLLLTVVIFIILFILPIYIIFKYNVGIYYKYLLYAHLVLAIGSFSNPYLLSGLSLVPYVLIFSYFIIKGENNKCKKLLPQ